MPRGLRLGLIALVVVGACVGLYFWTVSMGQAGLRNLLVDEGYCTGPSDCAEMEVTFHQMLTEQYGVHPALLDWCMGVDEWATAEVRRGAWVRDIAVAGMYLPCGPLIDDKSDDNFRVINSNDGLGGSIAAGGAAR